MEEVVPVVLVIVIVAVWIVILGPGAVKRFFQRGDQSISHFHYQLRVLEHSAPEPIVAPAYRLRAVDGPGSDGAVCFPDRGDPPVLTVVGAKELPRPALAFLGEPAAIVGADTGDGSFWSAAAGVGGDEAATWGGPSPKYRPETAGRRHVQRRRRDTLLVLTGLIVVSVVLGATSGSTAAWAVAGASASALVAYVALLVHLQRVAAQRSATVHYLDVESSGRSRTGDGYRAPATPVSGRYAHPSSGHALAR